MFWSLISQLFAVSSDTSKLCELLHFSTPLTKDEDAPLTVLFCIKWESSSKTSSKAPSAEQGPSY